MDIKQLELILATVQGVSGQAFNVALLYVAFMLAKELLGYLVVSAIIFVVYRIILRWFASAESAETTQEGIRRIRRALCLDPMGQTYGNMYGSQVEGTVTAVELMVQRIKDEAAAKEHAKTP